MKKKVQQDKDLDLYTSLPLLCAYLGYKHVKETEHYLRFAEEYHGKRTGQNLRLLSFSCEESSES